MEKLRDLVKKFTEVAGPSGREEEIREAILRSLDGYVDGYRVDKVGNLIVWKNGRENKKVLFDAHMDEIGVVVTHVDEVFLRVEPIGGMSPRYLLGTGIRFLVEPPVYGVVGVEGESIEEYNKNLKELSFDKIYVDVCASSKEELKERIKIGTFGVYDSRFRESAGRYVSKAMDDRIGCAVLVQLMRELVDPRYTVYCVFSMQEETGLVGASVAAYDLQPDVAIAVDVTATVDTPKANKRMAMKLDAGPAIKVMDRASISDRGVVDKLIEVAERHGIPHQMEVLILGGTNAAAYQRTRSGIPSATVSIPTRYVHSPHEVVSENDVLNTVKLLKHYVEEAFD